MTKKKDLEKNMTKVIEQLKVNLKKFGKDAGIIAKKGEKEIIRASKLGRLQLDIINFNLQKEKVYYDLGKKVASLRSKGIGQGVLKPYMEKIRKIEKETRKRKQGISQVKKNQNSKTFKKDGNL